MGARDNRRGKRTAFASSVSSSWQPLKSKSLENLAISTGRNEALSSFFEDLTNRKWELQDWRMQEKEDQRDQARSLERYEAQHSNTMEEIEYRDMLKGTGTLDAVGATDKTKEDPEENNFLKMLSMVPGAPDPSLGHVSAGGKPVTPDRSDKAKGFFSGLMEGANLWDNKGITGSAPFDVVEGITDITAKVAGHTGNTVADLPGVDKVVDSRVMDAAAEGGLWALDKITRPSHAMAEASLRMAKETNGMGTFLNSRKEAVNLFKSLDDAAEGAWAGLSGEKKTTFSDVIKYRAENDPNVPKFMGNRHVQTWGGLAADIVVDPLNLIGVGLIKAPIKASKAMIESTAKTNATIRTTAKELAGTRVLRDADDVLMTEDDLYHVLGGDFTPRNARERIKAASSRQSTLRQLGNQLDKYDPKKQISNKKLNKLEIQRKDVARQQQEVLSELGADTLLGTYRKSLELDVVRGTAPEDVLDDFDKTVDIERIAKALNDDRIRTWRLGQGKDVSELKSFDEAMGVGWQNDYRFKEGDQAKIKADAPALARVHDPDYVGLEGQSKALSYQIGKHKEALKDAESPKGAEAIQRQINRLSTKKASVDARKDRIEAGIIMNATDVMWKRNAGVAGAKGGDNFTDDVRAEKLLGIIAKAEHNLENRSSVSYTGVGDNASTDPTLELSEARAKQESDSTKGFAKEREDIDLDDDELFEPREGFFDSEQHYEAIIRAANQELDKLRDISLSGFDSKLVDAPASYTKADGTVDLDKVISSKVMKFDEDSRQYSAKANSNTEEYRYANYVASKLNNKLEELTQAKVVSRDRDYNERTQRLTQEALNPEVKKQRLAKYGWTPKDKRYKAMFKDVPGGVTDAPAVKVGDEVSFYGDTSRNKSVPTKADETLSARLNQAIEVSNIRDNPLTRTQVDKLRSLLDDANVAYPRTPKMFQKWMETTKALEDVKMALVPKNLAFVREFKNQHGMTLKDAYSIRDATMGRIVSGGTWDRTYPQGLSWREFVDEVTRSRESFAKVMDGAPVTYRGSGKTRTEALGPHRVAKNKVAERKFSNRWNIDSWKAFNEDPVKGLAEMRKSFDSNLTRARGKPQAIEASALRKKFVTKSERMDIRGQIPLKTVREEVEKDVAKAGGFTSNKYEGAVKFNTKANLAQSTDEDELFEALSFAIGRKEADDIRKAKIEYRDSLEGTKLQILKNREKAIKERTAIERAKLRIAQKEAKATVVVMKKRLKEDAIFKIIEANVIGEKSALSLQFLGKDFFTIPTSKQMFALTNHVSNLPILKQSKEAFARSFIGASNMAPEMQMMRNRMLAHTPNIVAHHLNNYKKTMGQYPIETRKAAFKGILDGAPVGTNKALEDSIRQEMLSLLHYVNGNDVTVAGKLELKDINRYLPTELQINWRTFEPKTGIPGIKSLMDAFKENAPKLTEGGKVRRKTTKTMDLYDDPIQLMWHTRVAVEQALAKRALNHSMKTTFGVNANFLKITQQNKLEGLGWFQHKDMGRTLFPPEIQKDFNKLMDMTNPENIGDVGRVIDSATGTWKALVTVYNPGYYTRNAVGEIMSSWFAGVNDPKVYGISAKWVRYAKNDGQHVEALKAQFPMLEDVSSNSIRGSDSAFKRSNGEDITFDQLHVMYHDQGLKSGFINTEYSTHFSKTGDNLDNAVSRKVTGTHDKLRNFGEWYEDYFRMAHFAHAIKNAPKHMTTQKAMEEAAAAVRKYHFDYTDFTNFEKTVMLRAFPFYKWTRKALPLMATMLFQKPGKVLAYPKVMHAVEQEGLTTDDVTNGDTGFMPNYQGIVPAWIEDMWAYKIGEDEEGNDTYFNMATPQMDTYKQSASPLNSAYGLLNPMIKVPLEQITGRTYGNMGMPMDDGQERSDQLMRSTPQGSMLSKLIRGMRGDSESQAAEPGAPMDEALLSFLTGLGFYENNPARKQGEMGRRSNQ